MIVLGVDPGTHRTGWGVVCRQRHKLFALDAGVIRATSEQPLEARLCTIFEALCVVIERHSPDLLAVEDVFSKHPRSALTLGHARGVVLLAGARADLPVHSLAPALVKRSVAGSGDAPKTQIARVVATLLRLERIPPTDASDALAIAITCLNAQRR